jgi:hypothetical protein
VWNGALQIELREAAAAQEDQVVAELGEPKPSFKVSILEQEEESAERVNRTALVRDQLRAHPSGMTTADLWKALQGSISNRAYLYSITKRLRDKKEIALRRGKFYLNPKLMEVKPEGETGVVH